jgi:hypothetical protein
MLSISINTKRFQKPGHFHLSSSVYLLCQFAAGVHFCEGIGKAGAPHRCSMFLVLENIKPAVNAMPLCNLKKKRGEFYVCVWREKMGSKEGLCICDDLRQCYDCVSPPIFRIWIEATGW